MFFVLELMYEKGESGQLFKDTKEQESRNITVGENWFMPTLFTFRVLGPYIYYI